MPRIKNWSVLTLFFISGFSGLIYQILWMRQFKYLLGSSIVSVSIIVAVFMLGLLVGSWWIGKKLAENKISDELKLYGKLELIIGVFGLLLLIILPNSKSLFALLGQPTLSFNVVRLIYNIVLTTILLVIPTAAMGATLPLLVSYFSKQSNTFRKTIAQFYSINALGGAFAAVLTGFFFIKSLGVNNSLVIAIILNVFIGLIVLILSRSSKTNIPTLKNEEINTGKGYRKRIKLNRHDQTSNEFLTTTWVEGIGGLSYINTPAVGPELYGFGELSCFAFNDIDFVYKSIFSKEKSDCNINFVVKEEDTLRIIENEKSRVKVFPNPARNTISLDGLSGHQVLVIIQDNIGRVVLENNTSNGEIDISFLERGVYFISLYSEEQELYSQKILKH